MKTFSWKQAQGLAWFFLVYALVRLVLSTSGMGDQTTESIGIFFGAMIIAWLAYTEQKSQRLLAFLATRLLVVSAFVFLYFGDFDKVEIMAVLIIIGGISLILSLFFLVKAFKGFLKKQDNILSSLLIDYVATIIFIVALEYSLPALKGLVG